MHQHHYVERIIDLMDPGKNVLLNISYAEAAEHVASGNAENVGEIENKVIVSI